jgi:hypothetical protein
MNACPCLKNMLIVRGRLSDMNHYSMQIMLKLLFFHCLYYKFLLHLRFFMCILHTGHRICCGRQEARGVVPVFHVLLLYEIESTACPQPHTHTGLLGPVFSLTGTVVLCDMQVQSQHLYSNIARHYLSDDSSVFKLRLHGFNQHVRSSALIIESVLIAIFVSQQARPKSATY